jgi:hypothetical protein
MFVFFVLLTLNGTPIAFSHEFTSKDTCEAALAAVIRLTESEDVGGTSVGYDNQWATECLPK